MASKILKDPFMTQFKNINAINQRLKLESSVYVLLEDRAIYLECLVPFIEKFGIVNDDLEIDKYLNCGYLPNEFFEFQKKSKKSKMICRETNDHIYLGQSDDNDIQLTLNKIFRDELTDSTKEDYRVKTIIPKFYNHFNIFKNYIDGKYKKLDIVSDLVDGKCVNIDIEGKSIIFTKQLFPSLKKDDKLNMIIPPIVTEGQPNKKYILFKEENEFYTMYTLAAFMLF